MTDSLDIICIGESLLELSTNEGLTYAKMLNKYYGGDTMTTAVAASRLNSKVGYITRVGNDYFKDFLLDSWQAENIDINCVKLVEGFNGLYFISRLATGEKEFAYYRKKSAATNLSVVDIPAEYISRAQIVYSTGVTQSLSISAREAVLKAFEIAKENGVQVAYDPNFTSRLWDVEEAKDAFEEVAEYIDIILLNAKHDAEKLFDIDSPDKIIKYLWDKGISTVVVKQGKDGSTIGYNGEICHTPACNTEVVDTTGSGDAFNGGFLHGIASGYTPFESAKLASIVACFQIKGVGAINSTPHREEVYAQFKLGEK